jgi:hypothetical protein
MKVLDRDQAMTSVKIALFSIGLALASVSVAMAGGAAGPV